MVWCGFCMRCMFGCGRSSHWQRIFGGGGKLCLGRSVLGPGADWVSDFSVV